MESTAPWKYRRTSWVLACLDFGEYDDLTENAKDIFKAILSCGTIDGRPGSTIRGWLLDLLFPVGVTHDRLVELFSIPEEEE